MCVGRQLRSNQKSLGLVICGGGKEDAIYDVLFCIFSTSLMDCHQVPREDWKETLLFIQFYLNAWVRQVVGSVWCLCYYMVLYFSTVQAWGGLAVEDGTTWHPYCLSTWDVRGFWLSSPRSGCNFSVPGYNWGISLPFTVTNLDASAAAMAQSPQLLKVVGEIWGLKWSLWLKFGSLFAVLKIAICSSSVSFSLPH